MASRCSMIKKVATLLLLFKSLKEMKRILQYMYSIVVS
jgi:hypothetical protein